MVFRATSRLAERLQTRTRSLISMRLALMDDPLRRVLGLAAAAGTAEISLSQLRAGAAALDPPVGVPALFDALDRALRMRLLEERDRGYAFRHPVLRAALVRMSSAAPPRQFRAALSSPPSRAAEAVSVATDICCTCDSCWEDGWKSGWNS